MTPLSRRTEIPADLKALRHLIGVWLKFSHPKAKKSIKIMRLNKNH
jgi:hypothetical protein